MLITELVFLFCNDSGASFSNFWLLLHVWFVTFFYYGMSPVILLNSSFLYNECCTSHRYTCKLECNCWFACQWKVNFQQNNNAVFILMKLNTFSNCIVLFQKISILPPTEGFLGLNPLPLWKFQFRLILPLKILAFETPPPRRNFQWTSVMGVLIFSGPTHWYSWRCQKGAISLSKAKAFMLWI